MAGDSYGVSVAVPVSVAILRRLDKPSSDSHVCCIVSSRVPQGQVPFCECFLPMVQIGSGRFGYTITVLGSGTAAT
ncbi:hypothetical protein HRbin36_02582 [bacterium HR36]|nr:hypothetical protein HRbin36_02582 [bacterium HR36]